MKIKKLVEILNQMNPEAEVFIASEDMDDAYKSVERVEVEMGSKLGEENFAGIVYKKEEEVKQ